MSLTYLFGPNEGKLPTLVEAITIFFMLISLPLGLIIIWKWELLGSILILLSIFAFHLGMLFQGDSPEIIPLIDVAIIPGILFFILWYFSRKVSLDLKFITKSTLITLNNKE